MMKQVWSAKLLRQLQVLYHHSSSPGAWSGLCKSASSVAGKMHKQVEVLWVWPGFINFLSKCLGSNPKMQTKSQVTPCVHSHVFQAHHWAQTCAHKNQKIQLPIPQLAQWTLAGGMLGKPGSSGPGCSMHNQTTHQTKEQSHIKKHEDMCSCPRLDKILTFSDLLTAFFLSGLPSCPWEALQSNPRRIQDLSSPLHLVPP